MLLMLYVCTHVCRLVFVKWSYKMMNVIVCMVHFMHGKITSISNLLLLTLKYMTARLKTNIYIFGNFYWKKNLPYMTLFSLKPKINKLRKKNKKEKHLLSVWCTVHPEFLYEQLRQRNACKNDFDRKDLKCHLVRKNRYLQQKRGHSKLRNVQHGGQPGVAYQYSV